jgi:hypothetical protein
VVSLRRGADRRGAAGKWATCADECRFRACWRGRGRVWRRSAPACAMCLRSCLPSPASAAGHNGHARQVVSELGRPLDNQAAAPCA